MSVESICIMCKIRIVDTNWRPEPVSAFCQECEAKVYEKQKPKDQRLTPEEREKLMYEST